MTGNVTLTRMYQIHTLANGLTVITIDLPHLNSVTTLVAVGAGSRYETKENSGVAHFLEHMFFKGSKKYPTTEIIAGLVEGIGADNNASTSKEYTTYWIKAAAKHVELATDILSSQLKDSLFDPEEIEREKGVIIEELKMYHDNPMSYVWELYEQLQFGDHPLGWDVGGTAETVSNLKREDFLTYMKSLYAPKNMVLVYAGNLPKNILELAEKYFGDLSGEQTAEFLPFSEIAQLEPRVRVEQKESEQVNLILGMKGYDRYHPKRFAARLVGIILGGGMSSRLFIQIRERRGLAYHISSSHQVYKDTGFFNVFAGLKVEKTEEAITVIKEELEKLKKELVSPEELKKAKEMERGRIALRSESTNFLAEYFAVRYVLDKKVESFDDYLKNIDAVSVEDLMEVAQDIFKPENYNLQLIAPFKNTGQFSL